MQLKTHFLPAVERPNYLEKPWTRECFLHLAQANHCFVCYIRFILYEQGHYVRASKQALSDQTDERRYLVATQPVTVFPKQSIIHHLAIVSPDIGSKRPCTSRRLCTFHVDHFHITIILFDDSARPFSHFPTDWAYANCTPIVQGHDCCIFQTSRRSVIEYICLFCFTR